MVRETELWRRVRALDRHVLGEPDRRDPIRLRFAVLAALNMALVAACVIAAGMGVFDLQELEPGDTPSTAPAEGPER